MTTPVRRKICGVITAEHAEAASLLWQYGFNGGPGTFSVALNATGNPADPITHYGFYDPGMLEELTAAMMAVTDGAIPNPTGGWWDGMAWGEEGLPEAAGLIAACHSDNLTINIINIGAASNQEHFDSAASARGVRQLVWPD